jgi:hypothetical protein
MLNLGIKTTDLRVAYVKHRREKTDLHKETTMWQTCEADIICEVETLRGTIDKRDYVLITQH